MGKRHATTTCSALLSGTTPSMAPSTMKQSTLSFGTRKSSSSTSNASKKPEPVVVKRPTRASLKQVDPIEEGSDSDQRRGISGVSDIELSSEEDEDEVEDEAEEEKPIKKQEEQTLLFKNVGKADRVQTKDTQLELDPDDDKWDGVYRQTQIARGAKKKSEYTIVPYDIV